MRKVWSDPAWDDYVWWQSHDRKTLKRINKLIKDIEQITPWDSWFASTPASPPTHRQLPR